jgi:magnesium transporter
MRRLDLPARDLRLLDPLFVYPSAILGRERAVVCNLERLRCIITADEALVLREPDAAAEEAVRSYVDELQRRLVDRADDLPFEFIALEVALEAACSFLDSQVPPLLSGSVSFWVLVESSDSHCLLHVSANDTAR